MYSLTIKNFLNFNYRKVSHILSFSLFSVPAYAQVTEPCLKWHAANIDCAKANNNSETGCELLNKRLTPQYAKYKRQKYQDSPWVACIITAKYGGDWDQITIVLEPIDADTFRCRYKSVVTGGLTGGTNIVRAEPTLGDRDPCCYYTVSGPYSRIRPPVGDPDRPKGFDEFLAKRGKLQPNDFLGMQKMRIRFKNRGEAIPNPLPDSLPPSANPPRSDAHRIVGTGDPEFLTDKLPGQNRPTDAEIHHIVPRKDSIGCPCGTNEYSNALVISRQLNGELLNDRTNAKLMLIADEYGEPSGQSPFPE